MIHCASHTETTTVTMLLILMSIIIESSIVTASYEYEPNVTKSLSNSSDIKKDMYVIHAMVYQVGIITNKTNNETDSNIGKEEAVTFFHSNGSKIDFSKIPQPVLTNVTAQSLVGIVPSSSAELNTPLLPNISNHWNILQHTGKCNA
ncbi:hypothetical protein O3G_MSEX009522 [Manduca sexta]|uniref:Uncharacterized protein n=1 Tax=Manduca sexta TaxID=7130 RepID=A0A921ZDP7_MANSE|nr:hypothetical protein O3G_MSEX009522 [Manduca sexta]